MSRVFQGKVRRVGNSLAVIVPKEILENIGAGEGDSVKLSIVSERNQSKKKEKKDVFESLAGVYSHSKPFTRDRTDRSF
jgi:antitoxin component of MazEF toxin-antitoxin module